jgi:hypothetical protein
VFPGSGTPGLEPWVRNTGLAACQESSTSGKHCGRCARAPLSVGVMRHLSRARVVAALVASVSCSALAVAVAEASFPGRNGRIVYVGGETAPTPFGAPALGVYKIRPDGTRRWILRNEPRTVGANDVQRALLGNAIRPCRTYDKRDPRPTRSVRRLRVPRRG